PTPVADALRAVKVQLGVTSNNELSNAYSVRGGSTNENQFFIDGFEIYRPIRTSQGEQEGLGLVNGDLAEGLTLYAGGFPVRYGGKLASVLDVAYARPDGPVFGTAYASTLDGGAAIQGSAGPVGLAIASRLSRPQSFLGGQELKGDYDPDFRDVQGVAEADLGGGHTLRAVGLAARHRFRFRPQSRVTTFGIFPDLVRTAAFDYSGSEDDGYNVLFGGLRLATPLASTLRAEHSLSAYDTEEFEQTDISSSVQFSNLVRQPGAPPGEFDAIPDGSPFVQADRADNSVGVATLTGGGRYLLGLGRSASEVGWQVRGLRFTDTIDEGTTITYTNLAGEEVSFEQGIVEAAFERNALQVGGWAEQALDLLPQRGRLVATAGVRADYYDLTDEWTVSPRLAAVFRAADATTFTGALGVYHQAPTYRELRGAPEAGTQTISINTDLRSQRADVAVLGVEHLFAQTRLTLRAEAYYKRLTDLISYTVDNVRVIYSGENDSEGYATGLDLQLRGELVPGLESWINYGFLVTEERFFAPERSDFEAGASGDAAFARAQTQFERNGGGDWVRRPTDRRHNLSVFIQDRIPGDDT
ncbi:MAG: TonB-dependent receptor, partial [Bacteroidota bacterium]